MGSRFKRRPSAGGGRCTAFARSASAGTGFRSHCRRAPRFGYLWASHASHVAQKRLNDAFPAILYSVMNTLQ
jgi:hypothetical protein